MNEPKIKVDHVYKIFGPNPEKAIDLLHKGLTKK